jgi:hypothetical protein
MPKAKVIDFPNKARAVQISAFIKGLSEKTTILAICIKPDGEHYWMTQGGEAEFSTLLGTMELIKAELIQMQGE